MTSADYVNSIEACFIAIRGRGVQWSPSDGALALRWHSDGVPVGLVVRVIGARVRAWRFRLGEQTRLPMHLGWYAPAIVQALRAIGHVSVHRSVQPELDAASLKVTLADQEIDSCMPELLDPLPDMIENAPNLAVKHAYKLAFELLDKTLRRAGDHDLPGDPAEEFADLPPVEQAIERCVQKLRKTIVEGLDSAELAILDAHVAAALAPMRTRLSKKALNFQRAYQQQLWLSTRYAVLWPTLNGWIDPHATPC
ncbi:MAG: hypothetical protein EXR77_09975 [Myxococcales bacterium]|nr:hypothetical protein [Myxococcales bacterium]